MSVIVSSILHFKIAVLQAKHRLKPLDKLIGKVEKLCMGENPVNAYIVISIGQ